MINYEEFVDFLKKYSTIPNKFIDDFFKFYKYNTTEQDIIINLELVSKWLNMRKDNLKTTITRSYIKDVDYKILNDISNTKAGRPQETILISTSCFRRLCMSSNTKRGKEVRQYYEKIELLLNKYKNHIIENLEKRVSILENNQKPKIETKRGLIYFIKTEYTTENIFKLGKTKKFKKRLLSHNSSHADDVEISLLFETGNIDQVEGCLKSILKKYQYRKRKEIYQIDIDILKETMEGCEELINRVNIKKKDKINKISRETNKNYNYFLYFYQDE
jgi:phage anti-repressor protein